MTALAPDTPLRLAEAAKIAFPDGSIGVRQLRTERDKGKLSTFMIAGREFTTLADIAEMIERCRAKPGRRDCGGDQPSRPAPGGAAVPESGSSSIAADSAAQDAARARIAKLRRPSPTTSRKATRRRRTARVVPLSS